MELLKYWGGEKKYSQHYTEEKYPSKPKVQLWDFEKTIPANQFPYSITLDKFF